jgi:hypothetical protein
MEFTERKNRAAQIRLFTEGNPKVRKLLEDHYIGRLSDMADPNKLKDLANSLPPDVRRFWGLQPPASPSVQRIVFVPASAFARFYGNKSRQLIHLWAKNGVLKDVGFVIGRDLTAHLSIGIPPAHEDYRKFLSWASKRQERLKRQIGK